MKTNPAAPAILPPGIQWPLFILGVAAMIVGSLALHAEDQSKPKPAQPVPPASYLAEQAIDQKLGLLNRPWRMNLVRLPSRFDLPPQLKPGGSPPYDQQAEKAQLPSGLGGAGS